MMENFELIRSARHTIAIQIKSGRVIVRAPLRMSKAEIERFELIKRGEVEPIRCERCDYCKSTKILTGPEEYEIEEAK